MPPHARIRSTCKVLIMGFFDLKTTNSCYLCHRRKRAMKKTLRLPEYLLVFGLPILLMGSLVWLSGSPWFNRQPEALSLGITLDLLLTVPLFYFFLIRKTNVPNTTVVPVLLLGVLIGSAILPTDRQQHLDLFKTWGLPLVEMGILTYVLFRLRQGIRRFRIRSGSTPDFYAALKNTCEEFLPRGLVIPVVTEIAVFYYGFVSWRPRKLQENEFSYHKDSGTVPLLVAIIFIIAIETFVFHSLLLKWSETAAWILTALSIYSGVQLFGFLRSMSKRPYCIEDGRLFLPYGIMSETEIDLKDIRAVEINSADLPEDGETRKLSFLGALESHNVVLRLKSVNTLTGLYGTTRSYRNLAFYVDDKTRFRDRIEAYLGQ